ncbi:MAG TPA: hypothetical protein VFS93_06420, partial [Terrimesophilobacter sp.]|nr:hypothetical protein [Terrimesophilobacter sp.]
MQTASGRPDRTLVVIVSVIAAVVILALVVVFTRGTPAPLDPTTPEGVVQAYTTAVIDGDLSAITPLLTKEVRDNCERLDPERNSSVRLTLVSTDVSGDHATVRVSIATDYGSGPFGSSSYQTEDTFTLAKEGGQWLV